ncbi:MAG: DUF5086 family protein [Lysobacterales bacterium]
MRYRIFTAIIILTIAVNLHAESVTIRTHAPGIWAIEGTEEYDRWVVIHNLEESIKAGVYHLEVIARKKGDPVWSVERLVNHMAITEEALSESVTSPLKRGAVYPEAFEIAYKAWVARNVDQGGEICQSSVLQCMQ